MVLYASALAASGCWRYVAQPDGGKGLWFGLVMGALALGAAWLLATKRQGGLPLAYAVVALAGGWFVYESFVRKGLASAEPRQLLMIGLSGLVACVLVSSQRRPTSAT
jgi:hypothetical protein